ncbi:unnamed protein product [Brugia timori]|uniref:Tyrosine--tRNA ligase n=1 Tax=Brugia timori TaxID=42155 RepID=A0A0R3R1L2_9BILA|nr:unnamed protein product [Brugia timori]
MSHFLGGCDQLINVGTEVLRTLDMHVGHFLVVSHFQDVTMNVKNNLNIVERLQKQYASIELTERTAIEHNLYDDVFLKETQGLV